nr:hypothetical protein [Neisseria meningitidis]
MITVKLTHGLTYNGKVVSELRLKPLTVGGELAAFALIDDLPELPENATKAELLQRDVLETLTYWSQQGIPSDILTAQWLMENLSTEDYHTVMAAQEDLCLKPSAATASPDAPSAAEQ